MFLVLFWVCICMPVGTHIPVHVGGLDTDNVTDSLYDSLIPTIVHHKRSPSESVTAIAHLALAGTDLLRVLGFVQFGADAELAQNLAFHNVIIMFINKACDYPNKDMICLFALNFQDF